MIFKDFEGDTIDISVTSCVFIDTSSPCLCLDPDEAEKLANYILQEIKKRKEENCYLHKFI